MDKKFVLTAFGYAILGLVLGIYMAASHNHGQMVTHAHIMLLGFVVSFIYAVCHKLWLNNCTSTLSKVQYWLHQLATAILVIGLFLLYGQIIAIETMDPILAIASITAFIALVLMKVLLVKRS
ncbi:TonB-dependent receptor [Porticoccaceae bacterium LTM1]|nr:TonB-dependent receptor [Porticoccaceae bacterium LTM1]